MNRYQQEVVEMDRRHALGVRGLTFLGSAALIVAALWAAGLPPSSWLLAARTWISSFDHPRAEDATPPTPPAGLPASAASPTARVPDAVAGTDSSVASVPQPLVLVSTSPGRNKQDGTARIGTSRDNPQTYIAGAILVNGARIAEIHSDHVLLQRGGESVELFVAGSANDRKHGSDSARELATTAIPTVSAPSPAMAMAKDDLSEVIRAMAHYENEQLAGLLLMPGRKGSTFAQLGLQSGDVVVAIDDVPIGDAQAAIDMLRSLVQGAVVKVRVRRGQLATDVSLDGSIMAERQ